LDFIDRVGKDTKNALCTSCDTVQTRRRLRMQSWYGRLIGSVLVGGLLLAGPAIRVEAGEPQEKVKVTVDEVVAILADKTLTPPERRTRIRQAVLQRFGFDEMAQRSLGPHWRALTPQQRQEFVELFTDLLERSYMNRMEGSTPGPQSVRYVKEDITADQASVHTTIMNERDAPVAVEYRLLHKDGDWKVYDIVIEGVSLVNNYRTQFNTIIAKDSYTGLVKQMRLKRDQENAVSPQKG
jgi:phospholipid transport system substrate-binding protein